jgi:1-acyl-sn-glycerol-3-phosphate acyltransferase
MLQWLLSLLYVIQIYLMMAVIGLLFAPWALVSRRGARVACKSWCRWSLWTARWMLGLRGEVRGPVPTDEVVVAAKHQSFLDIMLLFEALPAAKFIMKRELLWTPIIGLYAKRIGCVPVDRGKRGHAVEKMLSDVEAGRAQPGQLIIYPQGTRVAPGDYKPYKIGTALIYDQLKQPCVPAATNVGVFWPRKGILRKPGVATVEFLPRIEPGLARPEFMAELEGLVEGRSADLLREVGHDPLHRDG